MIIEPLRSLINDSSVPVFFENLVEGIVKLSKLNVSTNIQKYSKNWKMKSKIVITHGKTTIPIKEYK